MFKMSTRPNDGIPESIEKDKFCLYQYLFSHAFINVR